MKERNRKIGIEIENESLAITMHTLSEHLYAQPPYCWLAESDGSLRGGGLGWEIKTTSGGLPFDTVIQSLNVLYPCLVNSTGVWRAAVHVHVDCMDLTALQRAYVLCLAYAYDDSIFTLTGRDRIESNFCVPMAHKRWHVLNTIEVLSTRGVLEGYGKYTSVNANSLMSFGTIEFRHMRTPATDSSVASVVASLDAIKRYATIAYEIVDSVKFAGRVQNSDDVRASFLRILDSGYLDELGLVPNPEHVLDILSIWSGHASLPFELDLASVRKVSYRSREEDTPPEYPDERSFRDYLIDTLPERDFSGEDVIQVQAGVLDGMVEAHFIINEEGDR